MTRGRTRGRDAGAGGLPGHGHGGGAAAGFEGWLAAARGDPPAEGGTAGREAGERAELPSS